MAGNKHKDKGPRHIRLCHYMTDSQAWKSLGAIARAIYPHIAKRYAGVGSDNGRIGYSVREAAAEFHTGTSTAKRALDELQDRGFIVPMKKGAFSLKQRNSTEWRLTEFHCDVTLATKDFMTWTPDKNKTRYPAAPIGICSGTVHRGLA